MIVDEKNGPSASVLLFDGDGEALAELERAFDDAGISVHTSSSFEEFKGKYREDYRFVVFDLQMPDTDGIEILRYLADRNCSAILVLTSRAGERITRAAARLGEVRGLNVGGTLSKPITSESVTKLLSGIDASAYSKGESTQVLISTRAMRQKIEEGALNILYQPKVRLSTGEIDGVEALVRWPTKSGPLVSTPSLIYVAEKADLIDSLTIQILERGLGALTDWAEHGVEVKLSINVSPRSLNNAGFVDDVLSVIGRYEVPPPRIVFEVTEKAFSSNMILPLENLSRLGLKGFGISIDDFGTGHSSFERLNLVPFTELKLDKSFVISMGEDPQSYEIVRSALQLGKRLDVNVVAEGVESAEIWSALAKLGCDLGQGFYVSGGVSAGKYIRWTEEWRQRIESRARVATS